MRFVFMLLVVLTANIISAQDVIQLKNGEEIRGRVTEIGVSTISYKKLSNPDGPQYNVEKEQVSAIRYENETVEVFDEGSDKSTTEKSDVDYFIKGQLDADRYYVNYKTASTSTLFVSLLSPLVGLIPAIATSATPPKEINLGYPSSELYEINDYRRGYQLRARKIKSRQVWTNWGIAFGVNLVLVIALASGQ